MVEKLANITNPLIAKKYLVFHDIILSLLWACVTEQDLKSISNNNT